MNKAEINEMQIAAEAVDGSKVGEAYLEGRREKKNRLKQFLDAAQFNVVPDYTLKNKETKKV